MHGTSEDIAKRVVATFYGDESKIWTPWGPAQNVEDIARGVRWVSTAGHGGLGVAKGVAQSQLSPAARKLGMYGNGYFWYEEDVQYAIAFYEHPEWGQKLKSVAGGSVQSKEQLGETIKKYFPEYFEMSDLQNLPKLIPGTILVSDRDIEMMKGILIQAGTPLPVVKVTSSRIYLGSDTVRYSLPYSWYLEGKLKIPGRAY